MDKIVIEYSEMEQLYLDYSELEGKVSECIGKIASLSEIFKSTFVVGISANHLTDTYREENDSLVGFSRIIHKLSDLQTLTGMCKLHIDNTESVMKSIDEKISDAIVSDIMDEYGLTREQATEVWDEAKEQM